jgi:hypothetical protein
MYSSGCTITLIQYPLTHPSQKTHLEYLWCNEISLCPELCGATYLKHSKKNCTLCDKSTKLGRHVLKYIKNISGYLAITDLNPDGHDSHWTKWLWTCDSDFFLFFLGGGLQNQWFSLFANTLVHVGPYMNLSRDTIHQTMLENLSDFHDVW